MNPKKNRYFTYIRPIMRSKFARTYSSLIFSLITIAIFSYYAVRPTATTILSLQKSIDEQTSVLNTLKEKVNALVSGKQNYENIPLSVKSKLENMVPENPALPSLINSLTFAAQTSEASISGIQLQPVILAPINTEPSKTAQIQEVGFTFNTQGKFANLMKLLTTLKRLDRLISINSISFNQPADSSLGMSINGKAYYIKN